MYVLKNLKLKNVKLFAPTVIVCGRQPEDISDDF